MPRPIIAETRAKLQAALANEKRLIAACIEFKSTLITALLPILFTQLSEVLDAAGHIRLSIATYLPGGDVVKRCQNIRDSIIEFHTVQTQSLANTLPGFCKDMASSVLTNALPQIQASYAPSNVGLQNLTTALHQIQKSNGADSWDGIDSWNCLQVLKFIESDHTRFSSLRPIYLALQPQMERMIGFFKPVIGVIFTPPA